MVIAAPTNVSCTIAGTTFLATWTLSVDPSVTRYRIHLYKNGLIYGGDRWVNSPMTVWIYTDPTFLATNVYYVSVRSFAGTTQGLNATSDCISGGITCNTPICNLLVA